VTAHRSMPGHPSLPAWIATASILLAVAACKGEPEGAAQPAAASIPVAPEDVARAVRKLIRTGPRISGSLDARQRADMRAEAGGQVIEVLAELGQAVKKGQLLARIEVNALGDAVRSGQAAVRSARENLTVARKQVERTRALVEGGALAERDLESARSAAVAAEAQLGQAQAQLSSARTQLGNATIRSPMNGVVSLAPVHTGDVVAPGTQLFTVIDPSSMRLEASVPSQYLQSIAVGSPVSFEVRGYPGQKFTGTIDRVAPAADPATRQIPILVRIPNESGKLVAGLFAEGRLSAGSRETLVVPAAAIDTSGETPTATRVTRGQVERVTLQLGVEDDASELVEVVSGLAEGDMVLLRGARALPPGTRVDVSEGAAPQRQAAPQPEAAPPAPSAAKPKATTER
jgi:membrane fusion protein (multidrug efflux system)